MNFWCQLLWHDRREVEIELPSTVLKSISWDGKVRIINTKDYPSAVRVTQMVCRRCEKPFNAPAHNQ